jgi:hypothetical protein
MPEQTFLSWLFCLSLIALFFQHFHALLILASETGTPSEKGQTYSFGGGFDLSPFLPPPPISFFVVVPHCRLLPPALLGGFQKKVKFI